MAKRDFYEVLGISKTANADEIKKAYRQKAIQYHPDKNPGDKAAEEKFKEAAEAYEVLSNPEKKQRYDQFGHAGVGSSAASGGGGFSGGGMSMEDIFSQFGDIFGGHFGSHFGGFSSGFGGGFSSGGRRGAAEKRVRRGSDLRVRVKLTLKEIATGTEKKIKVRKYVSCKKCNGTGAEGDSYSTCTTCNGTGNVTRVQNTILGQMQTQSVCPTCGGEGKIINKKCSECNGEGVRSEEEVITIKIPAGVMDGMTIPMRGKGNAARRGGVNGDLLVVIEEEPHPELIRDENDLIYNALLTIPIAINGGTIEIPTVDGKAKVKVDPGTQPGKVLRLKGKGLPSINSYGTGDLLVNVGVYIPENVSKEERNIIAKLEDSENFKPNATAKRNFFARFKSMFE
ncbi:MAG: molecular chaperone DnaJ [Prevotellaceae bacterium]|jgi:molecular chaperone DnaJ|nr:molecular chaperone DnaJ [Prevotellaceae bacterium]